MNQSGGVPAWALLPAAGKLLVETIKHPNSGKVVIVDPGDRSVRVVQLEGETEDVGAVAATDPPRAVERRS